MQQKAISNGSGFAFISAKYVDVSDHIGYMSDKVLKKNT